MTAKPFVDVEFFVRPQFDKNWAVAKITLYLPADEDQCLSSEFLSHLKIYGGNCSPGWGHGSTNSYRYRSGEYFADSWSDLSQIVERIIEEIRNEISSSISANREKVDSIPKDYRIIL